MFQKSGDQGMRRMPLFDNYIGIDYSGAGGPRARNRNLAVAAAENNQGASIVPRAWSREAVYLYVRDALRTSNQRLVIGIDHGFSYPGARLQELNIDTWDVFLTWFRRNWRTNIHTVEQCKKRLPYYSSTVKRLVELEFTPSAKSVVDLDRKESLQGVVSYSTHAGLSWIYRLRRLQRAKQIKVHFWPFDGVIIPDDHHVILEAYPSLYRRRVALDAALNEHERDAFAIAAWMRDRDQDNTLHHYLSLLTLTPEELQLSRLEGWILGCL